MPPVAQGVPNTPVSGVVVYSTPVGKMSATLVRPIDSSSVMHTPSVTVPSVPQISPFPRVGAAADQMPGLSTRPLVSNLIEASNLDDLAGVEGIMPRFIRRKSAPAGHQVASGEIDSEMYDRLDGDIMNLKDLSSWLKAEKDEGKDEPWTRLGELATFALCGFG